MIKAEIDELALKFIEGEWFYYPSEKILLKPFATNQQLEEMGMIDEFGYLLPDLKESMEKILGPDILQGATGPFGDADIFSGDIEEDETIYNIELYDVTDEILAALEIRENIIIKTITDAE